MSNELTTVDDKSLQDAFGSVGFGDFGKEIKFPYLSIAAKGTDLAIEGSPKYIEGLKPGFFFNALTKRVYGKKVNAIILDYSTQHKEWTKKPAGAGFQKDSFVRIVPPAEIKTFTNEQLRDYTKHFMPNGNMLEEVKLFYLVLPEYKEDGIMQFSLGKGSFKHVRNWGGMVVRTGQAYPAHVWEVSTGLMDDGTNSWFTIGNNDTTFVKDLGKLPGDLLADVVDAFQLVQSVKGAEALQALAAPKAAEPEDEGVPY